MVTYGFYNSVDHDRTYDATQVSELFDGLINPGVYNSIGQRFKVEAVSNSFQVSVGTGRAWFNHTWTKNDAPLILNLPAPPTMADRYRSDAIVIDINSDIKVRENKITYVSGEESANPNPPHPTLASGTHTQIPLAYIRRGAENAVETSIDPSQVNYVVGTVPECPWVVGVLQTVDISVYVQRWETAWNTWFAGKQDAITTDINTFHAVTTNAISDVTDEKNSAISSISTAKDEGVNAIAAYRSSYETYVSEQVSEFSVWMASQKSIFDDWFDSIRGILDEDAAGHLQNEIDDINSMLNPLPTSKGGTGNTDGYIRTGHVSSETPGSYSTAEGYSTKSTGSYSHAEGYYAKAEANSAHAEGSSSRVRASYGHAEGNGSLVDESATGSHAEGASTAVRSYSHAEGWKTVAEGMSSHAEGTETIAFGLYSHAEGGSTYTDRAYSHAEGESTISEGLGTHSEGGTTTATGNYSHAEGSQTHSIGANSHAEGELCTSDGIDSHAEGYDTHAIGDHSHAGGYGVIGTTKGQFVHGCFGFGGEFNSDDASSVITETDANSHYVHTLPRYSFNGYMLRYSWNATAPLHITLPFYNGTLRLQGNFMYMIIGKVYYKGHDQIEPFGFYVYVENGRASTDQIFGAVHYIQKLLNGLSTSKISIDSKTDSSSNIDGIVITAYNDTTSASDKTATIEASIIRIG